MRIEHLAIYTRDLDRLRDFYVRYFGGASNERYRSKSGSGMESYFISFDGGARLELMSLPALEDAPAGARVGLTHLAFDVGSRGAVDALTTRLAADGYRVLSAPRTTGDGYYESVVADPDGNRVEITTS